MSVQRQRIESRLRREQRSRDRRAAIPLALLAFPLFLSVDLDKFSGTLDSALNAWKVLSAMVLVAMFIHRLMSRKPVSVNVIPMIVIMVFLALSTWVGEGDWQTFVIVWGGFFAVALLVEMTVRDQARTLLLALRWVLGAIVLLNFATVVLFPEGLWQAGFEPNWLLGHRNNFGGPLVSAIGVSAALDMITRRRLSLVTVGIAAAALASVVITWSASSVVAVFAAALVVLLASLTRHGLIVLRPWAMIAAYAATAIGVVGFRIQEHMGDFIEGVLNRSTDLTGRTRIWDLALNLIRESPVWGHGIQKAENNGLTYYDPNFVHAHNGELDMLLNGGLLVFSVYVVLLIAVVRRTHASYRSRAVQILYLCMVILLVRSITGLIFSASMVLLWYLLLNAKSVAQSVSDDAAALVDERRPRSKPRETSSRRRREFA